MTEAFAILLWLLGTGGMAAGLVLWARAGFVSPGFVFFRGPVPMVAYGLAVVTQASSGLILALRRPSNIQGWLTLVFGVNGAVGGLIFGSLSYAKVHGLPDVPAEAQAWLAWLMNWLTLPLGTLISVSIGFIFPDGRLLSPRWWIGIAIAAFGAAATAAVLALSPGPLVLFPSVINPLSGPGQGLGPLLLVSLAIFVSAAPLTGFALLRRYAMAGRIGRLQIRWFVSLSLGLEIAFVAFLASLIFLPADAPLGEVVLTVLFLSAVLPAIALVVAILRYRLYDIDTIISRTFVYGALTAILGTLYGASLSLFQRIFTTVTGETSDAALILTTLVLTTSFQPVKNRLEQFFAERFPQARPPPSEAAVAILDDPAFVAALDARIATAMAPAGAGGARARRTARTAAQDNA